MASTMSCITVMVDHEDAEAATLYDKQTCILLHLSLLVTRLEVDIWNAIQVWIFFMYCFDKALWGTSTLPFSTNVVYIHYEPPV
jgi:hypothetical protein